MLVTVDRDAYESQLQFSPASVRSLQRGSAPLRRGLEVDAESRQHIDFFIPAGYEYALPDPEKRCTTYSYWPTTGAADGLAEVACGGSEGRPVRTAADRGGGAADDEFPFDLFDAVRPQNTKQSFLESLFGVPRDAGDDDAVGGGTLEPPQAIDTLVPTEPASASQVRTSGLRTRFKGSAVNATHIQSAAAMAQLIARILMRRSPALHETGECVSSVDISYACLGLCGPDGPPLRFNASGEPVVVKSTVRFFPDQRRDGSATAKVRRDITKRSLALVYVLPLLFTQGAGCFHLTTLVCQHCRLSDDDAKVLALTLRKKPSKNYKVCHLVTLDLSFNLITDAGADYLKKAIKYNRNLHHLYLIGNAGITSNGAILDVISRRLENNKQGRDNLTWWQKLLR